jgi:hypothetical protein
MSHHHKSLFGLKIALSVINGIGAIISFTFAFLQLWIYVVPSTFALTSALINVVGILVFVMQKRLYFMIWFCIFTIIWIACIMVYIVYLVTVIKQDSFYVFDAVYLFWGLISWILGVATLVIWKRHDCYLMETSQKVKSRVDSEIPLEVPQEI